MSSMEGISSIGDNSSSLEVSQMMLKSSEDPLGLHSKSPPKTQNSSPLLLKPHTILYNKSPTGGKTVKSMTNNENKDNFSRNRSQSEDYRELSPIKAHNTGGLVEVIEDMKLPPAKQKQKKLQQIQPP